MVYLKMSMEIQLIHQIEKYEFLYNFNLPEYNRKDLVDEAWMNIASNTNLSVSDCKEKWRNIRSSFLRSMKPSGSKVKKPYYLTEYLRFILPFLKPINVENSEDSHYEALSSTVNQSTEIVIDYVKPEPEEYEEQVENIENNSDNSILNNLLSEQSPVIRKRRRYIPASRRHIVESMKARNKLILTSQRNDCKPNNITNSNSAMKMFLMSLLPELEGLSEDQYRHFKIKSMMLIDDIKSNYPQMKQNNSTLCTERLQKKLINLLLKSLQCAATSKNTSM